jgi:U4/U6 small nuclear ribonucleoprotein PRP3
LTHRSSTSNKAEAAAAVVGAGAIPEEAGADSLALPNSARDIRGKRGLKFVEAGKYVEQELMDRQKEERRVRFGFSSGRNAPEMIEEKDASSSTSASSLLTAPAADEGLVPELEWWDEAFLPKEKREARKATAAQSFASAAVLVDDEDINNCRRLLDVANCKTFNLVQHPVAIKALGGDKPEVPLPMYLTKKEQKRIRKTRRQQAEQERRDKQMMGLIPAPEPKFKLSNFMKILGDQAVADPSKVEARVMQQVRQREIAHEMRNLAAKLTPAQRREKQIRKAQEAASTLRQITVAAFCVKSLANPRHRFKVDMNAQQHYLTGTVVLCPTDSLNLVYVEGGPKGIRKFTRLMLHRIDWDEVAEDVVPKDSEKEGGDDDDDDDDDDDEEDDEDSDDDDDEGGKPSNVRAASLNRCELVWQGVTAKRLFSGLKFVEVKSRQSGRNLLEEKSLAHFWDSTESTLSPQS